MGSLTDSPSQAGGVDDRGGFEGVGATELVVHVGEGGRDDRFGVDWIAGENPSEGIELVAVGVEELEEPVADVHRTIVAGAGARPTNTAAIRGLRAQALAPTRPACSVLMRRTRSTGATYQSSPTVVAHAASRA